MTSELVPVVPALPSPTTPMREWNVIVAQAEMLAQSNIVPGPYQRKAANVIAAAIAGRRYGWDVMTAMLMGHVIEGKYGVAPEGQLGLIRQAGHSVEKVAEVPGQSVTVRGTRCDNGNVIEVTWTLDKAKAAGLAGKQNWRQYPDAMLWARAISELSTQLFSDVTLGIARYTGEELGDDGADSADAGIPARVDPPEGWESWEECDDAHDAYLERWKAADQDVRTKMTGYAKTSGYQRPMTKPQLLELEGELDVQIGAPAHRERPEPPAEDDPKAAAFDAETRDDLAAAEPPPTDDVIDVEEAPKPKRQRKTKAAPEAAETPGAPGPSGVGDTSFEGADPASPGPDGDGDGDATEPPTENATAGEDPDLPEGATPAVAPTPSDKGQHARLATGLKRIWTPPEDATARALLVSIITKGRTKSSRETTSEECLLAIEASKLIERGQLVFAVSNNGTVEPITHTAIDLAPGLPEPDQLATLVAAIPEGGTADEGNAFIRKVAEHQASA